MGFFDRAANSIKNEVEGVVTDAKDAINGVIKPKTRAAANFDDNDYRTKIRVPPEYLSISQEEAAITNAINAANDSVKAALSEIGRNLAGRFGSNTDTSEDGDIVVSARREITSGISSFLLGHGGIIFPYTPLITYDTKANYSEQNVMHSNYTQYFYKNSSISSIRVEGKFTVQNQDEGIMLLATIHLLRSLTKMRFGDDPLAGSPPPICRLDAYGAYMLKNVPVSVASFSHSLPDNVDYITVGKYGTMVPVLSTIAIDLNVMYSRQEMFDHNIPDWISGRLTGKGYL